MCDRQGKLALLPHRRRASVGDIVPTMELWNRGATNRAATLAYDLLLLLVAFWFAVSSVPWVPWTLFLLANLAGLFVFNNRFVQRELVLTRRWDVIFGLLLEVGVWIWLGFVVRQDAGRAIMAIFGLAFVVAVRLCFQPAEVATGAVGRPRRPGRRRT